MGSWWLLGPVGLLVSSLAACWEILSVPDMVFTEVG